MLPPVVNFDCNRNIDHFLFCFNMLIISKWVILLFSSSANVNFWRLVLKTYLNLCSLSLKKQNLKSKMLDCQFHASEGPHITMDQLKSIYNSPLGQVIFSEACVKNSVHRGVSRPTPIGGRLRGLARGVSRLTPRGRVRGVAEGVSRPTSGGGWVYLSMQWGRYPPADGYCCRWYAYYWNALLSHLLSDDC